MVFHLYLNLLAEVLKFGDREFYKVKVRFWRLIYEGLVELR